MRSRRYFEVGAAFLTWAAGCSSPGASAGGGGAPALEGTGDASTGGSASIAGRGSAAGATTATAGSGGAAVMGDGGAGGTAVTSSGGALAAGSGGSRAGGAASDDAGATTAGDCGTAAEGDAVTLACAAGQVIDAVVFASYGTPSGACGSFAAGSCDAASSEAVVRSLCVGRQSCTVTAGNGAFGDPCNGTVKSFAVEVSCGTDVPVGTVPFKGVANSPCDARNALAVSWYYNWTQAESEPCADGSGGEFVPMIWGHPGDEQSATGISGSVASFVQSGYGHVLGFNEPDNPSQSNIPVTTAISLLPSFDAPGILVGSPATAANANPGQAWFTDFMTQLEVAASLRVDFLAIHWYGWNAGSCDASAAALESYIGWVEGFSGDRPIWITEWGCLNASAPDVQTVVDFYNGALAVFARHPRIERYAWYPWATNNGLVNGDGTLTPLGEAYAAAPAYR